MTRILFIKLTKGNALGVNFLKEFLNDDDNGVANNIVGVATFQFKS